MKKFFEEFGPPRNPTPANPFTRLERNGLWKVKAQEEVDLSHTYSDKQLRDIKATGAFPEEVIEFLQKHPGAFNTMAEHVLHQNFPDSIHEDILQAVGLDLDAHFGTKKRKRDPDFRQKVLEAYERSCAVCGYQIRRDDQIVGLEAAHIKWHQFEGPDVEQNGIALCTMHHKLFDHGLFALNEELILKASTKLNGKGAEEWVLRFHGKSIRKPHSQRFYPEHEFTNWQVNEVFKGSYRD